MRIDPDGAVPLAAASSHSTTPSARAPVPQSSTSSVPPSVRTSTHEVLPPYRTVSGPGVGIDPRVPQNLTRIAAPYVERGEPAVPTRCTGLNGPFRFGRAPPMRGVRPR